jgi:hypothetical protein
MSAPIESCPLEALVIVVVRELAGAGMVVAAERVIRQAAWSIGHDAADEVWHELYGRYLFRD